MSRPTSLTPEAHLAVCRAAKTGVTRKCAAFIGGVSDRTLRSWCERGREGEEPFATFLDDLERAEAEVEQALTGSILKAAITNGDWRAAQFWLERRVAEWRPVTKTDDEHAPTTVNITVSGPASVEATDDTQS